MHVCSHVLYMHTLGMHVGTHLSIRYNIYLSSIVRIAVCHGKTETNKLVMGKVIQLMVWVTVSSNTELSG